MEASIFQGTFIPMITKVAWRQTLVRFAAGRAPFAGRIVFARICRLFFPDAHGAMVRRARMELLWRSICASTAARWRPGQTPYYCRDLHEYYPRDRSVRSSPDASGPDRTDRSDGPFDRRIARFAVRFRRPASCRHRATDSQQSFFRVQRVMVQKARSRSCCRRSRTAVALCS